MTATPTPLLAEHQRLGGRMIDFAGYSLPVQYRSILEEVRHVRSAVGLFDLSHMGRVRISGEGHLEYLAGLISSNVTAIPLGAVRYGLLTREDGTIIDDLLIYREADATLLCVNGANHHRDLAWLRTHAAGTPVEVEDLRDELAMIALQGPASVELARRVCERDPTELRYYRYRWETVAGFPETLTSRTGYTGEDGFEFWVRSEHAADLWRALMEAGADHDARPIGLGARDTLRLEAGMPLYGHEIDDSTTPVEANLMWAVDLSRGFVGDAAIRDVAEHGPTRKLVGFTCDSKRVPRFGYPILHNGEVVGQVRSGALSPTLDRAIGTAYVAAALASPGSTLSVDLRGTPAPIEIVSLPFYKRPGAA